MNLEITLLEFYITKKAVLQEKEVFSKTRK